ncbi:hypothetical protein IKG31_02405 [Candidatus Saccharibacteria bacterium]|nr:hypothetical protein [Candidatus Saccharibacteria bacterium]
MQKEGQRVIKPEINNSSKATLTIKKSSTTKYAMVICAMFAIVGVGFGIYGVLKKPSEEKTTNCDQSGVETELTNLKQKYAILQERIRDTEASKIETSEETDARDEEISWWKIYAQNYAQITKKEGRARANIYGNMTAGNGCGYTTFAQPTAYVFIDENGHLTISTEHGNHNMGNETVLEADGFLSAFYVRAGNGSMPSFILVNEQGETYQIHIDEYSLAEKKELELLPKFKYIVSAISGADGYIHLTDINGNSYEY